MRIAMLARFLGCLILPLAFAGCGKALPESGQAGNKQDLEQVEALGARRLVYEGKRVWLETEVKSAWIKGEEPLQRLSFESLKIRAKDAETKQEKLFLAAGSGLSMAPYQNFDLMNVMVQAEDGTEFEADRLSWQRNSRGRSVVLSGDIKIFTGEYLLEADTLKADAIFGTYLIPKLLSGKVLDDLQPAAGKD